MAYYQRVKHSRPRRNAPTAVTTCAETPDAPFAPVFKELPRRELSAHNYQENCRISETQVVASFNWLAAAGSPAKWTPTDQPRKLKEDAGVYYRDRNAAHFPENPMEPSVEAILKMNPSSDKIVNGKAIDIFGCGSTLGNLLRFVQGTHKTFRILVERVGNTVHLIRREKSPLETIPGIRGYGHTFPESYTTWDASSRGSTSHQRIIQYQFGGLTLLVRFEGDGYFPDKAGDTINGNNRIKDVKGRDTLEELGALLSVSEAVVPSSKSGLKISEAGCLVPQRAVFDLKTRSIKRKIDEDAIISDELPRPWLRQIPNLVLAYHTAGTFDEIQFRDIRAEVAKWDEEHKDWVARLQSF